MSPWTVSASPGLVMTSALSKAGAQPSKEVFDSFGDNAFGVLIVLTTLLGSMIPVLLKIPNARTRSMKKLNDTMEEVSEKLLERSRKEKEMGGVASDTSRSIIGSLRQSYPFMIIRGSEIDNSFQLKRKVRLLSSD